MDIEEVIKERIEFAQAMMDTSNKYLSHEDRDIRLIALYAYSKAEADFCSCTAEAELRKCQNHQQL